MEFLNLTPFGAAAYRGLDVHDQEYDVVAVRTVYRLRPGAPSSDGPTWLMAELLDEEAPGLVTEDRYSGAVGQSSVIVESDLAPFKPRCDVLVTGHSFAPFGRPAASWLARLRISQPARHPEARDDIEPFHRPDANRDFDLEDRVQWQQDQDARLAARARAPGPDGEHVSRVLVDKTLRVHAPRFFEPARLGGWQLRPGTPVAKVALLYEHAYGGRSRVENPEHGRDASRPAHLLDEVNFTNPLGCGWLHSDYASRLRKAGASSFRRLPAPQFEYPDDPVRAPDIGSQAPGLSVQDMLEAARTYRHRPAGFGAVGRAWTPRIQAAGRYDQAWLDQRWPNLPRDFDMRYWNCAPADQQMDFPAPDMVIELGNLVDASLCPTGHAVLPLPGHRASVLFRLESGLLMGGACVIDTVHLDTDAMELSLTWRASLSRAMNARVAELRFEVDPARPLFALESRPEPSSAQPTTSALEPG